MNISEQRKDRVAYALATQYKTNSVKDCLDRLIHTSEKHFPIDFDDKAMLESFPLGMHRGKDISDALARFLKKPIADFSSTQKVAAEALRQMLLDDRVAPGKDRQDAWTDDEVQIMAECIDQLFFNGAVYEHIRDISVDDAFPAWGLTNSDFFKFNVTIILNNLVGHPNHKTRNTARARLFSIIAHEYLHAIFPIKMCRCFNCFEEKIKFLDTDYSGHGPFWNKPAIPMARMFLDVFGDVIDFSLSDWMLRIDPIRSDQMLKGIWSGGPKALRRASTSIRGTQGLLRNTSASAGPRDRSSTQISSAQAPLESLTEREARRFRSNAQIFGARDMFGRLSGRLARRNRSNTEWSP